MPTAALTLALICAAPAPAFGWNRTGHSIVAYIAYKMLDTNSRKEIDRLLQIHFKLYDPNFKAKRLPLSREDSLALFTRAAWWPDEIKSDSKFLKDDGMRGGLRSKDFGSHRQWHFIDQPFTDDNTEMRKPEPPHLLSEITRMRGELSNPSTPDNVKAYDLVWLIHLVGDIHQPLHCTTRFTRKHGPPLGDAGGNLFLVTYSPMTYSPTRLEISLHSYWDGLFNTSDSPAAVAKMSLDVLANYKPEGAEQDSEQAWAEESFQMAKEIAYSIGPDGLNSPRPFVSTKYSKQAKDAASKRIVLAGYRLAHLLNESF